jgi:hypothetical protein
MNKYFDYRFNIITVICSMARKKYIDKRNWPEYNDKLVRRGELYVSSIEIVDSRAEDLAQINHGNAGRKARGPKNVEASTYQVK